MLLPAAAVALRQPVTQIPNLGQRVHHGSLRVQDPVHGLVVIVISAHMVVLHHHAVALPRPLYSVCPGEVQPLSGLMAYLRHTFGMLADLLQFCRHGACVFVDQEAVHPVGDALCGAAPADQHRRKVAGCRLPHHKAVGIVAGGEQEQVCPAIPRPQSLPLGDGPGENALAAQWPGILLHRRRVRAAADEHHAEILPSGL